MRANASALAGVIVALDATARLHTQKSLNWQLAVVARLRVARSSRERQSQCENVSSLQRRYFTILHWLCAWSLSAKRGGRRWRRREGPSFGRSQAVFGTGHEWSRSRTASGRSAIAWRWSSRLTFAQPSGPPANARRWRSEGQDFTRSRAIATTSRSLRCDWVICLRSSVPRFSWDLRLTWIPDNSKNSVADFPAPVKLCTVSRAIFSSTRLAAENSPISKPASQNDGGSAQELHPIASSS